MAYSVQLQRLISSILYIFLQFLYCLYFLHFFYIFYIFVCFIRFYEHATCIMKGIRSYRGGGDTESMGKGAVGNLLHVIAMLISITVGPMYST